MNSDVRVARAVDLTPFNTLGVAARAAQMAWLDSADDVQALLRAGALGSALPPPLVLGGGSNTVFAHDPDGWVLHPAMRGCEVLASDDEAHYVAAAAGENWHDFVMWTLAQGLPGLENLALIPGSVGAAPIQNIGAYGLELAERFHGLDAVSLRDGSLRHFKRDDCAFAYRDSVFKQTEAGRWLIVRVVLRLPRRWQPLTGYADLASELAAAGCEAPTADDIAAAVMRVRRRKLPDPAEIGNAGSFFKNPLVSAERLTALQGEFARVPHYPQADGRHKLAAGWLIEQCGWKGRREGAAGCHANQALVLVNHGGASGADIMALAARIRADVQARFGVELEIEPRVV